jgi:oligoendopeptidase F
MEDYVLDEIMEGCDDETRLSILVNRIGGDISTIERQVACYLFEKDIHSAFREKGYLSKEEIGNIFKKNMESYMGKSVEQSPGSENWWVYWSHIRSYFYVYSYASGLLIAKSLQESLKRDSSFIREIKGVLSSGLSKSPHTTFIECGIDISDPGFWNRGLEGVERSLSEAESLARKLGKI